MRSDITIYRDFRIVAGRVIVPGSERDNVRPTVAAAEAVIAGSSEVFLSMGSGRTTGSHFGSSSMLRLPGLHPGTSFATNPVDQLTS